MNICTVFMLGCFVADPGNSGHFRILLMQDASGAYHIDEYNVATCADAPLPDEPPYPEKTMDTDVFLKAYDAHHGWELRNSERRLCRQLLGAYEAGKRDAK